MLPVTDPRDFCCTIGGLITDGGAATYADSCYGVGGTCGGGASNNGTPQTTMVTFITDQGRLSIQVSCTQPGVTGPCPPTFCEPGGVTITAMTGETLWQLPYAPSYEITPYLTPGPVDVTLNCGSMVRSVSTLVPTGSQLTNVRFEFAL